ncbi:MAG: carboxypeptidase regulatory-like domain-containing protein [Anaerolineae bacterium]|nr:carboxypeptidase regulatory-like domain-containing protein [Anaerolineae bacterium]
MKRHISAGMVFVFLLAGLWIGSGRAYAASPNVYTSVTVTDVTSGAAVVGSTFTTDVTLSVTNSSTPEVGVMGAELWIPFDSVVVSVVDYDGNPANGTQVQIKQGFFDGSLVVGANQVFYGVPTIAHPVECDTMACVHVAVSHTGGSGPVTNGSGPVATITWAGLAAGATGIGIAKVGAGEPPGTVLSDADGHPIAINSTTVPSISVVEAGTIQGTVVRQGTMTNHAGVSVTALAVDDGVVASTTTAGTGAFSLQVPVGSTYIVQVSYNGYLDSRKTSVYVVGTTVDIGTTRMRGGDTNHDNCVNILDIVSIIGQFGASGLPASDPEDINNDGTINILDLTMAAGNFGRCGPTNWEP